MILVATNARDLTSDFVVLALERRNVLVVRLNTETLPTSRIVFCPSMGERGWIVSTEKQTIRFSEIRAGYIRRPEAPTSPMATAGLQRNYCTEEWSSVLISALRSIESVCLNSWSSISEAEDKPKQLAVAARLGFSIPKTLITNDFSQIRAFVADGPSIAKTVSSALIAGAGDERVIYTTRIETGDLKGSHSVEAAPIIVQREIKKRFDIRVTVVGQSVFAAEIHSQSLEETSVDWRMGARVDLVHCRHDLPDEIAKRCVQITRLFGLRFSAIDLVLDRDGRYWFLELNPNGQWAWIEKRVGLPISDAIADELIGITRC